MEESGDDNRARRRALRGADRERLLRYVASILEHQNTPLRDVVRDRVLPRLPVQPLRRFRSVSRSWHASLSSPFFAHTQSATHRSLSGFFFFLPRCLSYYLPLDPRAGSIPDPAFFFLPDTVSVVASCNGLVACRSSIDPSRYYISNPATMDWTALPRTLPHHAAEGFAALVFQPSALDFSADYHLVCVCVCPSGTLSLHVFSSALSAWRPSDAAVPKAREPWSSVAVGGLACWPNRDGSVSSYDPITDKVTVIIMPPPALETAGRWELAEMGGNLCCVAAKQGTVEVWSATTTAAIGGGATWRRLASVGMAGEPQPMASEGKEDRAVVCVGDQVVAIDVGSGEWRVVRDGLVTMGWDACVPYISSLVAVKEFCYGSGCYTCRLHCG
ncbi:uncharacterized protein M6B38_367940 [Iris pallida]|uniref:F-box protein At3g26010-like beta-propeller domain-containing protein n=1 Tax=Iris pallida TaxID=29817 RepID=A0AAX6GG35_IRIPA|nr:uncharacterized protein M6B38_367940 [Iris pallida]